MKLRKWKLHIIKDITFEFIVQIFKNEILYLSFWNTYLKLI